MERRGLLAPKARMRVIEVICSDLNVHRERLK